MARLLKLDRWLPLAEAARLADTPLRPFRRRVAALNRAHSGALLRRVGGSGPGARWLVSAEALMAILRSDPSDEITEFRFRLETLESRVLALRNRLREATKSDHKRPLRAPEG